TTPAAELDQADQQAFRPLIARRPRSISPARAAMSVGSRGMSPTRRWASAAALMFRDTSCITHWPFLNARTKMCWALPAFCSNVGTSVGFTAVGVHGLVTVACLTPLDTKIWSCWPVALTLPSCSCHATHGTGGLPG